MNTITKKVLRISGGLFLLLLFACNSNEKKEKPNEQARDTSAIVVEKGVVVSAVPVRGHAGESFALFVPLDYNESKSYPVIFFFDPSAKGSRPLEKYKGLAERYNVILAGSNNSTNGLALESSLSIARNMMKQVRSDLHINDKAVFTGGFSGGSRVACNIATTEPGVKGVIGCSAGFTPKNDSLPFIFAGITADEDMNYLEMQKLELQLDENPGDHILISGNGRHEWPDTTKMKYAIRFIMFRSLKNDIDPKMVDELIDASQTYKSKVLSYSHAQFMYRHLEGIRDVGKYKADIEKLGKDPEVKKAKADHIAALDLEEKLQQKYGNALVTESAEWWTAAVKKLEEGKAETKDIFISRRLLNMMSLQCYMLSDRAMKEGNGEAAMKFLTIYSKVDDPNPEWAYRFAVIYASAGVLDKTWQSLKQASDRGFSDADRVLAEPAFQSIKDDDRFRQLVDRIRSNK
jgi:hypothetical protein